MNLGPNLEDRLRNELARSAPEAVSDAPNVPEMEATVAGRRHRNRVGGVVGAAVLAVGIIGGAVLATLPESDNDVIATSPEDSDDTPTITLAETDQAVAQPGADEDAADAGEVETSVPTESVGPLVSALDSNSTQIEEVQPGGGDVSVSTQKSAVEFAGGSGVFLTKQADGYRGLASRFGGDEGISAIGLQSSNGLDWEEYELIGIPGGTTATALMSSGEATVALFSKFDVEAQQNMTYVGTSSDLATWALSPALPGDDAIATVLAAGPAGVVVVGVSPEPTVWTGPVGGPFERVGSIARADTVAGVVAIQSGFVAVGTTADFGATLFDSVDGQEWVASPMSNIGAADTVVSLAVTDGTIMIGGDDGDTGWTAMSSDGGQSWVRSELDAGMVSSIRSSGRTVGFLGTSPLGSSTVTLSDGESWSSADLGVSAPDRIELLAAASDQAVLLATIDGNLTWILAER